jgi:hypothetical protein
MSTFIGYFTEIEMLKQKIKELEEKLQEERQEHRDIFSRMKADNELLKEDNAKLHMENSRVKAEYTEANDRLDIYVKNSILVSD